MQHAALIDLLELLMCADHDDKGRLNMNLSPFYVTGTILALQYTPCTYCWIFSCHIKVDELS